MNKHTTPLDWLEGRRRRAWELKQQGWKQQDIATALGVTKGAVSQWMRRAREGGVEALRRHPPPGPTPKLTAEQLAHLPQVLERGAEAYGYRGQVWTTKRVDARHLAHLWGELPPGAYQPSLAVDPPERATADRTSNATRRAGHCHLAKRNVADAEKKAVEEERTIVWVDQSGFYLLPMAVRTWAPVGQTPVLRVKLTRDHLAAISGITPDGRLLMQMQDRAYRAEDVVRFLRLHLSQDSGQTVGDLGWLADPSGQGDQSLPG
jgi:transposase